MRALWVALVLLAVTFAGCVSEDKAEPPAEKQRQVFYADGRITIENITDVPLRPPTLDEAPQWRLGEWWRIELTDDFIGETYRSYRVVAGTEGDDYLVGMPMHDFSNDLMVLHVPGFGQVGRSDLSFEVHDCLYEPLKFPLTVGKTWDTQFECRDVSAEVIAVDGFKATVELIGDNDHITLTYDGELRAISEMILDGYATYKVIEHGFDFHERLPELDGTVTVPHMHDVIFMHGRAAGGALSFPDNLAEVPMLGGGPNGPYDSVEVDSTYDRVSFVIILGNLWGLSPAGQMPVGGYYHELATAPDGTTYEMELLPDDPAFFKLGAYKHDAPGGTWEFEHIAAGPGLAMAEGIAYHVYDVELPSGRILPSVGEHQHGTDEGH